MTTAPESMQTRYAAAMVQRAAASAPCRRLTVSPWRRILFDCCWFLAWAVGSSAWCLTAAGQLGATFDEPIYVREGLQVWRTGSHHGLMKLGTMPLPVDVITLPLHLLEVQQHTNFDIDAEMEQLLPLARAGTLVFWWLLLLYVRVAAGRLGGPWAGRLALAWIAFEPNFLAHASLATTDIAVTACLLALVYHFRMGRDGGWFRRLALPAFWFGAAVLAKASGLVFGGLCLAAVELEYLARSGAFRVPSDLRGFQRLRFYWNQFRPFRQDCRWIVGGGLLLVFLFVGSDWEAQRSFVAWADALPDGVTGRTLSWLAHHLLIFSNAAEGLARQVGHNVRGHGVYLLGKTDRRAFWYYFPVLMTIKLTVPLLLTPLFLLMVARRTLTRWPFVAAGALLLFTPLCRVQIGIRFMLPLVALLVVGLAAGLVQAIRDAGPLGRRRLLGGGAILGVAWTVFAGISVWPHALCYANELWGGTRGAYVHISETNYDWGQGLKELARWQQAHGVDRLAVWYFGTDPALERLPMQRVDLRQAPPPGNNDPVALAHGHYLAVSTTLVYGSFNDTDASRAAADFLRRSTPIDRTQTFLIYDLTR